MFNMELGGPSTGADTVSPIGGAESLHEARHAPDVIEVWPGAHVWCGQERTGAIEGFLITSGLTVRALLVHHGRWPTNEHPVAWEAIREATHSRVDLGIDARTLQGLTLPSRVVMIDTIDSAWAWTDRPTESEIFGWWDPHDGEPHRIPVSVPDLEPGDVIVRRFAEVRAAGQHIGRLVGVRGERNSGVMTAAIVDVGHRWHHRRVVVGTAAIEELTEMTVRLRGETRIASGIPPGNADVSPYPITPEDANGPSKDDQALDSAHAEAAHLLADEAQLTLLPRGFSSDQVLRWADAFCSQQHSGDVPGFLAWIERQKAMA